MIPALTIVIHALNLQLQCVLLADPAPRGSTPTRYGCTYLSYTGLLYLPIPAPTHNYYYNYMSLLVLTHSYAAIGLLDPREASTCNDVIIHSIKILQSNIRKFISLHKLTPKFSTV